MAIADRAGLPVAIAIAIASASPHEVTLVEATLNASFLPDNPQRLIADTAYDSDPLDRTLTTRTGLPKVEAKSNPRQPDPSSWRSANTAPCGEMWPGQPILTMSNDAEEAVCRTSSHAAVADIVLPDGNLENSLPSRPSFTFVPPTSITRILFTMGSPDCRSIRDLSEHALEASEVRELRSDTHSAVSKRSLAQ